MEPISEILTNFLYLGDNSFDLPTLEALKITTILCCHEEEMRAQFPTKIVKQIFLSDLGISDILAHIPDCIQYIENVRMKGERILIHCLKGINRSPSIVIAYLMTLRRCTLREAFNYVREKRKVVLPSVNYMKQLITYETNMHGIPSVNLEEYKEKLQNFIQRIQLLQIQEQQAKLMLIQQQQQKQIEQQQQHQHHHQQKQQQQHHNQQESEDTQPLSSQSQNSSSASEEQPIELIPITTTTSTNSTSNTTSEVANDPEFIKMQSRQNLDSDTNSVLESTNAKVMHSESIATPEPSTFGLRKNNHVITHQNNSNLNINNKSNNANNNNHNNDNNTNNHNNDQTKATSHYAEFENDCCNDFSDKESKQCCGKRKRSAQMECDPTEIVVTSSAESNKRPKSNH